MKLLKGWRVLFLIAVLLAALQCVASDDDEDDDSGDLGRSAYLSLHFDRAGDADVYLTLSKAPQSWEPIRAALAQALHCPTGSLANPTGVPDYVGRLSNDWSPAQRERYAQQVSESYRRQLKGRCTSVLAHQGGLTQGTVDYSSFAAELGREGSDRLQIGVVLPSTKLQEYTRDNLSLYSPVAKGSLTYDIALGDNSKPALLHLAFGLRRSDVLRAFAILGSFLFLPFAITLWMRHVALNAGSSDPVAARFGFFRALNWVVTIAMLLWITSGLGARPAIEDWIAGLNLARWSGVTLDVLAIAGPAFLVYLLCMTASFQVDARLRGTTWTRKEFFVQQLAGVGAQALPLMFLLAAIKTITQGVQVSVALLVLTVTSFQLLKSLRIRALKTFPLPLTTGELRDRVFKMAETLGVKLTQIFVLPMGRSATANAFAAKNKIVIFTDYLLQTLTKREVEAVAAHELAHLKHKHPTKLAIAFFAAIFLPSCFGWISGFLSGMIMIPLALAARLSGVASASRHFTTGMLALEQWSQRDFVLIMLGLTGFYMLSRRFEDSADATAVLLGRDPEAQITGLLKLSRANFTPIHWGRGTGSWLSHPSTLRRVKRIAAIGGVTRERLDQILQEHSVLAQISPQQVTGPVEASADHYALPAAKNPESIRSAVMKHNATQRKLWALRVVYLAPPTLVSLLIKHVHLEGMYSLLAYAAGALITFMFVTLAGVWLGASGTPSRKRLVLGRFVTDKIPINRAADVFVGFAPVPYPRLYGTQYHWDSGFLVFARDRLQFVGEQTKFSLNSADVNGIVLGCGAPSWWKYRRVYVRWTDPVNNRSGVFNLYPLEPCSTWTQTRQVRALCERLQSWHQGSTVYEPVRPEFADLQSPAIGQVTSISPKLLGTIKINVAVLATLLLLGMALSILTRAETWYVCGAVVVVRLLQCIPFWRYRETPVTFPPVRVTNDTLGAPVEQEQVASISN